MGVYKIAEQMINEMVSDLVKSQNIMKYIVYDDVAVDPLTKPDVTNPTQYIFNPKIYASDPTNSIKIFRIYQTEIPNVIQDAKTIVKAYLYKTIAIKNNPYYKKYLICFDVVTHNTLNAISGGKLRVLEIMDYIHELYNQKYTSKSIQNIFPIDDTRIKYNDLFCGYSIMYEATAISSSVIYK